MITTVPPGELAIKLKVPVATLAQWRYKGVGPAYIKVGRHVRYRVEDVESWLNANRVMTSGAR